MKPVFKHISPLLATGLICLFFSGIIYPKIIGRISLTGTLSYSPDTMKTILYADIVENWAGY